MGWGHGPFGFFSFGHSAIVLKRIKGLLVVGYKSLLDSHLPMVPRGYKAVRT